MYTQQWYFIFPFGNIIFSFLIAQFLGTKRHIGFWYSFLWGIGFTFIVSWIVSAAATPLNEPYKKNKRDIYTSILFLFMAALVVFSFMRLFKAIEELDRLGEKLSYFDAQAKKTAWQCAFFIIGGLTTIRYLFDPSIGDKKKEVMRTENKDENREFVPEVPNYEIAEREALSKKNSDKEKN